MSINTDKTNKWVQTKGEKLGAFEVNKKTIPEGLEIKKTTGTHFEIQPTRKMKEAEFLKLLDQVEVKYVNKLE